MVNFKNNIKFTLGLNKIDNGELLKINWKRNYKSSHLCHTQFVFISFKSFKLGGIYMLWFISTQIIKRHWVMYFQECLIMFYIFSFNHRKRHIAKRQELIHGVYNYCSPAQGQEVCGLLGNSGLKSNNVPVSTLKLATFSAYDRWWWKSKNIKQILLSVPVYTYLSDQVYKKGNT